MLGITNAIGKFREYKVLRGSIKGSESTNLQITGIPFNPVGYVVECATQDAGLKYKTALGSIISPFFNVGTYLDDEYVEYGWCRNYATTVEGVNWSKLDSYYSNGTLTIPAEQSGVEGYTAIWDSSYTYNYVIYG